MPRRQYAPVPASQGDADNADRQIEEAFDIGEEDHDDQNHDHTPLLARHDAAEGRTPHASRTPITNRPTTSGGLYNFEYDFPPPGSPPADLAIANTWGNTNGVIISDPVNYNHNSRGNWVTRTWRTLTGTGRQAVIPEAGRVGGGTNNDGVFSNLSSRPTARITRPSAVVVDGTANDDTIFHAPELTRDDVPPSYAAAQADTAPPYWENTVLASAPDDFLIDSIPAGSLLGFIGVSTQSTQHLFLLTSGTHRVWLYPSSWSGLDSSSHTCLASPTPGAMALKQALGSRSCAWVCGSEPEDVTGMETPFQRKCGGPVNPGMELRATTPCIQGGNQVI